MNYGELKTAIEEDSHRSDLASLIPRFIREGEGMIRRELKNMSVTYTLTDTDRPGSPQTGLYTLPSTLQFIRSISTPNTNNPQIEHTLTKVSPAELRSIRSDTSPVYYAERGATQVEIRGVPKAGTQFTLEYVGQPAALDENDDNDTNSLLTNHESLYIQGALSYLYLHVQDLELAQVALDEFGKIVEGLNELYGDKHGGASIAGAYNLYGGNSSF